MKITIENDFTKHTMEFTNIDVDFTQILTALSGVITYMMGYDKKVLLDEIHNFLLEQGYDDKECN